jgi:DNA-binding NtrC family response regulator
MPDDEYDVVTRLRRDPRDGARSIEFEVRVGSGLDAGKVFVVRGDEPSPSLVGKSQACAICLADPEVSRRHASLEASGATLRLVDLGSTNGTFVNGLRVFDAALVGGERVQLGGSMLLVTAREGEALRGSSATSFGPIIGASAAMRRLFPLFERAASARVPVLIEGETGTGKELLAEALHRMGPRRAGPLAVLDAASISPALVEEALFGREAGGAPVAGVFEQAHGGTLVIDEVGDLSLDLQGKLLRVLDRGEVRRVGAQHAIHVDVRIVATTRRDLDAMVQAGQFRDDLFFRLAVARIELPPLRKRLEDVPALVDHFWRTLGGPAGPPPDLVTRFVAGNWPGNVRELQNAVARTIALGDAPQADAVASPRSDFFAEVLDRRLPLPLAREKIIDAFERAYVARVLQDNGGSVARAAAASGLALRYFQVLKARQARTPPA